MVKIIIVRPPLQQSSINVLKPWAPTHQEIYTNSELLAKIRPNTKKVEEPSIDQLKRAQETHDVVFVYPSIERLKREASLLSELPGEKKVIVDGRRVNVEDYLSKIPIPNNLLTTPNGATLRVYQQQLVDFILKRKRVGLFVDMGLGKTLATLAAVNELFQTKKLNPTKPVLVVAPKMVALDTWAREVDKWGYDMNVLINIGLTKPKRRKLFDEMRAVTKPTIVTTNPEQLKSIIEEFQYENPFELIVVDELSLFKSAQSQRFEHLQALTENLSYFIGLTGTPAPNSLLDVWSQLVVINPDVKYDLGHTFYQYRSHFFSPDVTNPKTGVVFSWKINKGAEDVIYEKIEPYVVSLRGNNLVDIPSVNYVNEFVTMDARSKDIYDYFDKEIRKQLKDLDSGESISVNTDANTVTVANSAILKSKLLQLATGAMYDETSETGVRKSYTVFHDKKIEKLKEIIETSTSPILVFYNYISDLERIQQAIKGTTLLDTKSPTVNQTIKKWNEGKIPVLLANPKSTGHGLNLQEGGHIIIWFSLTWNNEAYRQANKRLHRPGQTHAVNIIHIVTKDTADEEIRPRIDNKEDGQQELLENLEAK